ncbi:hypothetical protein STSP2_00733 [Anaerohalosphaera lusitana]|uniref:Uncharacterized protein n=1 Tax=Anaerohalosphaera lusitana TaxID=1936003 RepID=A0A1U9NID8_9BACT|nr:hypothetical protein [Anaerohalosphaera lusitana]AQT67585.1 hypothetical protein STSP2_00733 [Anaerohalosphaera lusitana]
MQSTHPKQNDKAIPTPTILNPSPTARCDCHPGLDPGSRECDTVAVPNAPGRLLINRMHLPRPGKGCRAQQSRAQIKTPTTINSYREKRISHQYCHCERQSRVAISTPTIFNGPFTLTILTILLITSSLTTPATAEDKPQPKPQPKITVDYVQRINELTKPENYDPAQNAMPLYEKAFELLTEKPPELPKIFKPGNFKFSEEEVGQLKQWVDENDNVFDIFRQAARKKYAWKQYSSSPEGCDVLFEQRTVFNSSKLLELSWSKAVILAHDGNFGRAFDVLEDSYRSAHHVEQGGLLVDSFFKNAIVAITSKTALNILEHFRGSIRQIKRFRKSLNSVISPDDIYISYSEVEKQYILDSFQRIFSDDGNGNGILLPSLWLERRSSVLLPELTAEEAAEIAAKHPDRKTTCLMLDEMIEKMNSLLATPPWKLKQEGTTYHQVSDDILPDSYILREEPVLMGLTWEATFRAKASLEALDCVLAIMQYEAIKHRYPARLDDISYYLDELPIDPYSGKPLVYKRTPDGFTLYSVGADFEDDNGKHSVDWGRKDGDYVFWPVEKPKKKNPAPKFVPGSLPPGMKTFTGTPPTSP